MGPGMTVELPVMRGLLALGPEGPFPVSSQPRWFAHRDGLVRSLDLPEFTAALLADGTASEGVAALAGSLERHGCSRILWACGHGGTPGHVNATWDVRLMATGSPAEEVHADLPREEEVPGTTLIETLDHRPGVITAFTRPFPPDRIPVPRAVAPWWARWVGLQLYIDYHHEQFAGAILAVGHVLTSITVTAGSRLAAEDALIRLVDLVAYDLASTTGRDGRAERATS